MFPGIARMNWASNEVRAGTVGGALNLDILATAAQIVLSAS